MADTKRKLSGELRKFGITMAIAFGIIGGLFYWRGHEAWTWLAGIAAAFLLFGLIMPGTLWPIEWAWMKLAHYLSIVMTYVILTLTFFLAIFPMGLLVRLLRKDLLSLKFQEDKESYWIPVEQDGPGSRPRRPY